MPSPSSLKDRHLERKCSLYTDWFEIIESISQAAKADADRVITENRVQNEQNIILKLRSIDFDASALPTEVLMEKQDEEQPCGDIAFYISDAINRMEHNLQDDTALDLRKIDNGIYQIAYLATHAINGGLVYAARAACRALSAVIGKIRDAIPSVPVPLQKEFMESAEQYIDLWMECIIYGAVLDGMENSAKVREGTIVQTNQEMEHEMDTMAERLSNDEEYKRKFERVQNEAYAINGSTWDADAIKLYHQLLDLGITTIFLKSEILRHHRETDKHHIHRKALEDIMTALKAVPPLSEPDGMHQFHDMIHKAFVKMEAQETQLEELLSEMNQLDEEISSWLNKAVTIEEKEEVSEQLLSIVEQVQKKFMEENGTQMGGSKICVYTKEELEQIKQKHEQQQAPQETQETQETQANQNHTDQT